MNGWAQEGCPGCLTNLPEGLAADTAYLAQAPDAQVGVYYEEDISFRLPKTTTPVANENTPPGLSIDQITVNNVTNIPSGLSWEANQTEFDVSEITDGCVRICGTPLQPGFYEVEVVVTARVLLTNATTSFSFPIFVRQAVTETEGFTMINNSGCGELEVSFQNKIPSNGQDGFRYLWDFGNGSYSVTENPTNQYYSQPGAYPVRYEAVIDTAGYSLSRIVVNEVGCDDVFNRPDLQILVFNADNVVVYSSDEFSNVIPPLTIDNLNIPLDEANYFIQVIDRDSGVDGGDDNCGIVNFNRYTSGKLVDSDMSITINIAHVVDTIRSIDTVHVFAQPDPPLILTDLPQTLCNGDSLILMTNYDEGLQWYQDSLPLLSGNIAMLTISKSADYWVQYTSPDGCVAVSASTTFSFPELPISPVFTNTSNELSLYNADALPRFFELQWLFNEQPIDGATQFDYCIGETGEYLLQVTDQETGCVNSYRQTVSYDPGFPNCVSSAGNPLTDLIQDFKLFPNPVAETLWLEWRREEHHEASIFLRNAQGQVVADIFWADLWGQVRESLDVSALSPGIYFLEVAIDGRWGHYRVVKQ